MLQYLLTESAEFSTQELVQMAIEGGCGWIDIHLPELTDEDLRRILAGDVVDMCREAGVFLVVDDRPELARELGLHGVRFTLGAMPGRKPMSPAEARDLLGPEAVIGFETADPTAVSAMAVADIDFVNTPAWFDDAARQSFAEAVKALEAPVHLVASGNFTPDGAAAQLAAGYAGVLIGKSITDTLDPVVTMRTYISALSR